MKVVILAGGKGTRLREETEFRPKPMVEIGGRPILWHIMKIYAQYGYKDFVVCLGYKAGVIKDYFLNYEAMNNDFTICLGKDNQIELHGAHSEQDYRVTLVDTGLETPTGGRIKRIERFIDDDRFMVTYGDGLANINISELVQFHSEQGRVATVTAVRESSRFGWLEVDSAQAVRRFREKPASDGLINGGFFVFEKRVFDYLSQDCVLEKEPLELLAAEGELAAFTHKGFWQPMDTYREYTLLNELWDSGRAPWCSWRDERELVLAGIGTWTEIPANGHY